MGAGVSFKQKGGGPREARGWYSCRHPGFGGPANPLLVLVAFIRVHCCSIGTGG